MSYFLRLAETWSSPFNYQINSLDAFQYLNAMPQYEKLFVMIQMYAWIANKHSEAFFFNPSKGITPL